jgi:hypothetical protein
MVIGLVALAPTVIDLHGDASPTSMGGIGQGLQAWEHLVAVGAKHLRMGFALRGNVGMSGDDQTYTATSQRAVKIGQRWQCPTNRLGCHLLGRGRSDQPVFQFQASDRHRGEQIYLLSGQ